ncbi:hypothetical protein DFH27DRAFT_607759 [Peziza echinospora]|nr:hypothetical protein DFH27DRAFT_607759 [Peziza echinospora]
MEIIDGRFALKPQGYQLLRDIIWSKFLPVAGEMKDGNYKAIYAPTINKSPAKPKFPKRGLKVTRAAVSKEPGQYPAAFFSQLERQFQRRSRTPTTVSKPLDLPLANAVGPCGYADSAYLWLCGRRRFHLGGSAKGMPPQTKHNSLPLTPPCINRCIATTHSFFVFVSITLVGRRLAVCIIAESCWALRTHVAAHLRYSQFEPGGPSQGLASIPLPPPAQFQPSPAPTALHQEPGIIATTSSLPLHPTAMLSQSSLSGTIVDPLWPSFRTASLAEKIAARIVDLASAGQQQRGLRRPATL